MPSITKIRAICDMLAHPDLGEDALDDIHTDLCARLGVDRVPPTMAFEYPPMVKSARLTAGGDTGELTSEQKKAALTLIGSQNMKRFMKFRAQGDDFFEAEQERQERAAALSAAVGDVPMVMR